jgi:hypothetical protein
MDPALGMRYEEARKKAKRFAKLGAGNVVKSLVNQARLCEGENAAREIIKEVGETARSFSGMGNAQLGIGEGERLGDGHWKWHNGKWERI